MFFCWCALECYKIIPVTNLMNVSCSCHSNLTLYLPELEVRRFNYLMSPLPSYLSLWRVKLDCLDSNLPVEMKHMEDAVRCQLIFLVDWLLNSKYKFVRFYNLPSADIRCWQRLEKSHSPKPSEFRSTQSFTGNVWAFVFRPSSWPKSITASPCWSSGSRWSRGCCTRFLEPGRTLWTWLKI